MTGCYAVSPGRGGMYRALRDWVQFIRRDVPLNDLPLFERKAWRGVANDQHYFKEHTHRFSPASNLPIFCLCTSSNQPSEVCPRPYNSREMTYSRTFLIPNQTGPNTLRGRLFSTRRPQALTVQVPFTSTAPTSPTKTRFVVSEACFYDADRQPYIHSTLVNAKFRGRKYSFKLYYKNHVALPLNHSLPELSREEIRGDVLAIAYGSKVGERSFTGMETAAADSVVRR